MVTPQNILGPISASRVLDMATGSGNFIHFLLEGLKDYDEIIGVDNNERAEAAYTEAFKENPKVRFQMMDAQHLDFDDSSFDLACISNSLHHLDPLPVLHEMKRILRPNGFLLVSEMYRDGQTETQMTHVHLHHWWAAVDRVNGVIHNETYTRQELLDLVSKLNLKDLTTYDLSDLSADPKSPELTTELDPVFERYIQRSEGHHELQARGEELKTRVKEIGFHGATTLVVMGRKV
jgi:ubiquinone/menaquinone biosynthesis C-methylase UbiE